MNTVVGIILQVLTFNMWALPDLGFHVLAPFKDERINTFCKTLEKEKHWDVVLLQEVWLKIDREKLKRCGYPYTLDLNSKSTPIDSGLMILSRYPILEGKRLMYPGLPSVNSVDGENWAKKGAIAAKIAIDGTHSVWVANTHLVSQYDSKNDVYYESRKQQLELFVSWAQQIAGDSASIVGGDLNFDRDSKLWIDLTQKFSALSEPTEAINACTICPPNTMHVENEGKVDHLFGIKGTKAIKGSTALISPIIVDGLEINLSDHFGWETQFEIPR